MNFIRGIRRCIGWIIDSPLHVAIFAVICITLFLISPTAFMIFYLLLGLSVALLVLTGNEPW